jgi:hypothetical protein
MPYTHIKHEVNLTKYRYYPSLACLVGYHVYIDFSRIVKSLGDTIFSRVLGTGQSPLFLPTHKHLTHNCSAHPPFVNW